MQTSQFNRSASGGGLVGICPGPALVNLGTLSPRAAVFVAAMVLGILLQGAWRRLGTAVQLDAPKAEMTDGQGNA